jgi:predicted enzyme related to lactoylglutathione lyase
VELVDVPGTWVFSDLSTPDPERAIAFYREVFGWVPQVLGAGDGAPPATLWLLPGYGDFLEARDPGLRERQAAEGAPDFFVDAVAWVAQGPPRWRITFAVDGTDAAVAKAVSLGAKVVTPPTDRGPTRVADLEDPLGHPITLSTYTPPDA